MTSPLLDLDAVEARLREGHADVASDFRGVLAEAKRLRTRLDAAHDALTRITEADDDAFTTLESTVEYVVTSWRAIAESEAQAADEIDRLRAEVAERLAGTRLVDDLRMKEIGQLQARIKAVESLCRSYTPEPPPIFQGLGLSEFGHGNNHGMRTLADAVLATLRGENGGDDDD